MMKSVLALAPVAFVLACGAQSLDGGSESDGSRFVRQALAANTSAGNDACNFKADVAWPRLAEGVLDIKVRDRYDVTLLLQTEQSRTGMRLESAHVRVLQGIDGPVLAERDNVVNGFVDAGGLGVGSVSGLDELVVEKIRTDVFPDTTSDERVMLVVEISVKGAPAAGGAASTTPVFRLPVAVCKGCLVSFEQGDDPATPVIECNRPIDEKAHLPCRPGQDEITPCYTCLNRPACQNPQNLSR
jgi:hypothetical protein